MSRVFITELLFFLAGCWLVAEYGGWEGFDQRSALGLMFAGVTLWRWFIKR